MVCLASERAGLTPTGHKFVIYSPRARAQLTAAEQDAVAALEADLEGLTPAQDRAAGRRCVAQSEGVDVAGVPIGGAAYVRGYARAKLAEHRRAHERIRLLTCVHSACVILRVSLARRFDYLVRACGPLLAEAGEQREAPIDEHDRMMRETVASLLTAPADTSARRAAREAEHDQCVYDRAALPCKLGGLGLGCMAWVWRCCFVSGVCSRVCPMCASTRRLTGSRQTSPRSRASRLSARCALRRVTWPVTQRRPSSSHPSFLARLNRRPSRLSQGV